MNEIHSSDWNKIPSMYQALLINSLPKGADPSSVEALLEVAKIKVNELRQVVSLFPHRSFTGMHKTNPLIQFHDLMMQLEEGVERWSPVQLLTHNEEKKLNNEWSLVKKNFLRHHLKDEHKLEVIGDDKTLPEEAWQLITDIINEKGIEKITLSFIHLKISDAKTKEIREWIKTEKIKELNLSDNVITDQGVHELTVFREGVLKLDNNSITNLGLMEFKEALCNPNKQFILSIAGNKIPSNVLEQISDKIQINAPFNHLFF